jgi:hypothetical protein
LEPLRIKINAVDTSGNWNSTETVIIELLDNDPPIARAGGNITIDNGEKVIFNGNGSYDNDLISNYTWSFEYGYRDIFLYDIGPKFQFVLPGYYDVELIVTDSSGLSSKDSLLVTVTDTIPPVPIISGTFIVNAGEYVRLDALNSTDNGAVSDYEWSFIDNEPMIVEGPALYHLFERRGTINITLTITDEWNLSTSKEFQIDVIDTVNPIANCGEDLISGVGMEVELNGSLSDDDGMITVFYWTLEHKGIPVELYGEIVYFTFDEIGQYHISLTVFDQSGNFGSDTLVLTVIDKGWLEGTVFDEKGNTIRGAKVEVIGSDGKLYQGLTSLNGTFSMEVPMGTIQWTISASGYSSITGTSEINPMETTILDLSGRPLVKIDEEDFPWFLILVLSLTIIISAIVITVLIFVLRSGSKGEDRLDLTKEDPSHKAIAPQVERIKPDSTIDEIPIEDVPMFTAEPEMDSPSEEETSRLEDLFEE